MIIYILFQIIILIDDTLNITKKRSITKEIKHFIEKTTRKINIKYEETRSLAYKIDEHDKAWFIAMQIKLKSIGANKRIKEIIIVLSHSLREGENINLIRAKLTS